MMYQRTLLVFAALFHIAIANDNSAFAFNANVYLVFDGVIISNHPSIVGYPQARNHQFEINPQADDPQTYCPTRVQAAGECPTPTPTNEKTQFNTTLDQNGPMGEVYMNVAVPGGQQLYVEKDGLLRYTYPHRKPPTDSYTDLFSLVQHFDGSQLEISNPSLLFNSSIYWYSCAQSNGGLNLTYAPTPTANITDCLGIALLSESIWLGPSVAGCPENPQEDENGNLVPPQCGYAAYVYD